MPRCSSARLMLCGAAGSIFAALVCVLVLAGCSSSQTSPSAGDKVFSGWTRHQDPAGFSVDLPAGWNAAGEKGGRIDLTGSRDEQVIIWPAWAPQGLDMPTATAVLRGFVTRFGKELRIAGGWSAPQAAGAAAVRTLSRDGGRAAIATLAWIPTAQGAAVFLYATAAPEGRYRDEQEDFGRILQSLRITGSPSRAGAQSSRTVDAGIHYVSWTDPHEGAFTLEVPSGWSVEGGLIRRNALDPRVVMRIKSPDGALTLSSGDGELPGFVLPSPQWVRVFPEGSWYSPGAGIQWQVRRFTPALPFGEEYLRLRLPSVCTEFEVKDRRDRPDLQQEMDLEAAGFRQYGQVTDSAGEIAFTCNQNGQPRQGDLLVSTQLIQSGVLRLWYALHLLGYLAPAPRVAEAQAVLAHGVKSMRVDPQWVARQQQTTMQVSQIASQTQEHISNTIMSTYWNKVTTQDETMRRVENSILGTTDVVDPATGERKKIENSADYFWINNRGVIVGTNTSGSPGVDFRQLTQLP